MGQDGGGAPGAQHLAVLDAVRAECHGDEQRHHLAARIGGTGGLAEVDPLLVQRLDPQPCRQGRRKHDAGIRDRPLVVEDDCRRVVHHESDLLIEGRGCLNQPLHAPFRRSFFDQGRMGSVDRG
jgi:hypothetical protein